MTALNWKSGYRPVHLPDDVAAEIMESGFLDPYDTAYTILQGKVLIIWPMMRGHEPMPQDAQRARD